MTEPQPVNLTAYLAEVASRFSNVDYAITTASPRQLSVAVASASDVPRLLAAVEAVLERHAAWEIRDGDFGEGPVMYHVCKECCAAGGGGQSEECAANHALPCWPCGTAQDLARALLGEGE